MQDGANGTTTVYDSGFFAGQRDGSLLSARVVVPLVLGLFPVRSVVDIGCGVGTWLSVFAESGVSDLAGYDGDYVDRAMLAIPPAQFNATDLSAPVAMGRRFDLAVCLEVAEHLSEATGPTLIETLTTAAPVVLFSAAIPGQGGTSHINEQWPDYWRAHFARHGYQAVDCLRPRILGHPEVEFWYQQNTLVYCAESVLQARPDLQPVEATRSLNLVHPQVYAAARAGNELFFMQAVRQLPGLFLKAAGKRLGSRPAP